MAKIAHHIINLYILHLNNILKLIFISVIFHLSKSSQAEPLDDINGREVVERSARIATIGTERADD